MDKLKEIAGTIPLLVKLEIVFKNKVPKEMMLLAYLVLNICFIIFPFPKGFVNVFLMIFPFHETIMKFQSPLSNPEGYKYLLLFWSLFSFIIVFSPIIDTIFGFIPLFNILKFFFIFFIAISEKTICDFLIENIFKRIPIKDLGRVKISSSIKNANKLAKEKIQEIRNSISENDVFRPKIDGKSNDINSKTDLRNSQTDLNKKKND